MNFLFACSALVLQYWGLVLVSGLVSGLFGSLTGSSLGLGLGIFDSHLWMLSWWQRFRLTGGNMGGTGPL